MSLLVSAHAQHAAMGAPSRGVIRPPSNATNWLTKRVPVAPADRRPAAIGIRINT
jgi:hypothetical protein